MISFSEKISIKNKLSLIIIISLISYISLAFYFFNNEKKMLTKNLQEKGVQVNDFLAKISAIPIQSFDYISIINYIKDLKKDSEIAYVIVYKTDGTIITKEEAVIKSQNGKSGQIKTINSDIMFYGQKIGMIETGISLENMNLAVKKSINRIIIIFFLLSIISLILILLVKEIINPIKFFTSEVKKISSSSIGRQIIIHSGDEIGELADAFNKMAKRLKESHDLLEEKVYERTKKLQEEIEERTAAERKIKQAQVTLLTILNSMPFGVLVISKDKVVRLINHSALKLIGYKSEKGIIGKKCYKNLCPNEKNSCPILDLNMELDTSERELLNNDGEIIPILKYAVPIVLDGEEVILESFIDITNLKQEENARKALEAKLIETARKAGMAEIATSVLHNIGNAVNSLNVRLKLFQERLTALINQQRVLETTDLLESHLIKCDATIANDEYSQKAFSYLRLTLNTMIKSQKKLISENQFLIDHVSHICEIITLQQSYSKGDLVINKKSNIEEIIVDSTRMLGDILQKNRVVLETDFLYSGSLILNPHQLIQVFINLIKNAVESIASLNSDLRKIWISTKLNEKYNGDSDILEISVKDTGQGFDSTVKGKIFTYGFTTKEPHGKGFGLHFCANYLQSIGGNICAESEGVGKGAQFLIKIPINNKKYH